MEYTEKEVLKAVYESGLDQYAPRVIYRQWRDSIDIDVPTSTLMDFVAKLTSARVAELEKDLDFAFKRTMVLARMLDIPVLESPAVTGTILGMVRAAVQRLMGRKCIDVNALADKFLAWPLPDSVCADFCATQQNAPHRVGTNLLTAIEAKQMIEHLLKA